MDSALAIENLKQNLYEVLNNSGLTIGTAYYVCKDVLYDLEKAYVNEIRQEQQEMLTKKESPTIEIEEEKKEEE